MARIIIAPGHGGSELDVDQAAFDAGFFPGYVYVRAASGTPSNPLGPFAADMDAVAADPTSAFSVRQKAAYGANAIRQRLNTQLGVPVLTGGPGVAPVATTTSGSTTGYTFRTTCQTAVACTDIRLVVPWGWYLSPTTGDTVPPQSIPFKFSIELTNGVTYPVTFRGARSVSIDPGGTLISDPIGVDLPAGTLFAIRWYNNINTSGIFTQALGGTPMSLATVLNTTPTLAYLGGSGKDGISTVDVTDSGAAPNSGAAINFGPPMVLGQVTSTTPVLFGIGDSITTGTGDFDNVHSWFTRGAGSRPSLRWSRGGLQASAVVGSHLYTGPLLELATDAVVMLGINDIVNIPANAAATQASLTSIYQMCRNRGLRVWGCTILPRTTSTDNWATTGNQTLADGAAGARTTVNDWIRAGAGGLLNGYFETADVVETARNSGLWKVNGTANAYTVDGTHPSPLGHSLLAAPLYNFAFPAP